MPSPIALFVYNRPDHTKRAMAALAANLLAAQSDLFIFSDAAKNENAIDGVQSVRELIHNATGFKSITVIERNKNLGLAASIIDGVTRLCNQFGQAIVVEDDLVTSPYFLTFLNDGLNFYRNESRVASIHGYSYPVSGLPETYFLRGADCWGWATWKRAWDHFEANAVLLHQRLISSGLRRDFDLDGAYDFSGMLEAQIAGEINSWAIRWHLSTYLENMLTLYPGESLVLNIGNDSSGTHAEKTDYFGGTLANRPIVITSKAICEDRTAREKIVRYLRGKQSFYRSVLLIPYRLPRALLRLVRRLRQSYQRSPHTESGTESQ